MYDGPNSDFSMNVSDAGLDDHLSLGQRAPSSPIHTNAPLHAHPTALPRMHASVSQPSSSHSIRDANFYPLLTALSLPKPEIVKFSGNVAEYQLFVSSFDARIASRVSSPMDKLYFLHQNTEGEARDLIAGCFHLLDEGYAEARRLLDREYGDPFKTSTEFVRQISDFSLIPQDDARALRKFATLLNKCLQAMRHVRHLSVLDHPSTLLVTVSKLPDYLQNKWRECVYEISRFATPTFEQLVQFVVRASDIANDPVFGKSPCVPSDSKPITSEPSLMNFSISAKLVDLVVCVCCGETGHSLKHCPTIKAKSVDEKRTA